MAQSATGMTIILHFPGHQNRRACPLAERCSIQQIEGGQKQAKELQPPIHSFSPAFSNSSFVPVEYVLYISALTSSNCRVAKPGTRNEKIIAVACRKQVGLVRPSRVHYLHCQGIDISFQTIESYWQLDSFLLHKGPSNASSILSPAPRPDIPTSCSKLQPRELHQCLSA
ncbi:hypothetical protein LY78DRAFT_486462 [Colletotrichum sublineola]|nr:hypothetical protein LY78DRAFT_486462 [Colletotrichum sublineola]